MVGKRAIGVDLGGTKVLAAVVGADGRLHETAEEKTPLDSEGALLDALEAVVRGLLSPDIEAVGFAVPARVDAATGTAFGAVNVPLHQVRLRDEMAGRLGLPAAVANDASAA